MKAVLLLFTMQLALLSCNKPISTIHIFGVSPTSVNNQIELNLQEGEESLFATPFSSPFSIPKTLISFETKIDSIESLRGIEIRLYPKNGYEQFLSYKVTLYSEHDANFFQNSRWQKFTFGISELHKNSSPINMKIAKIGFYISATKKLQFKIRNIKHETAKISPTISLTFDDGYVDQYVAAKIMKRYNLRGTMYTIPDAIGKSGYVSQDQVNEMKKNMGWGISAHHQTPLTTITKDKISAILDKTSEYFTKNNYLDDGRHLAYPEGRHSYDLEVNYLKKKFKTGRIAGGGIETQPPADRYSIRAYNVTNLTPIKILIKLVEEVKQGNQWGIFMFHYINSNPSNLLHYDIAKFETFIKKLSNMNIEVLPIHEAWKKQGV